MIDRGRKGDELGHEQLAVFVWAQRQVPLVAHILDQPHIDRPQLAPHRDVEVPCRALVELHLDDFLGLEHHVGLGLRRRRAQARLDLVDAALHVLDVRRCRCRNILTVRQTVLLLELVQTFSKLLLLRDILNILPFRARLQRACLAFGLFDALKQ